MTGGLADSGGVAAPRHGLWDRTGGVWTRHADTNAVVGFVDSLLRGVGQVMFQNNALTGLLFLVGIFLNSVLLGLFGLLGLATSTLAAHLLGADRTLVRNGLFGFNGVLVGIGLAFYLQADALLAAYVVVGAIVSTVVMMALANLLAPWDLPALTAPFVLTTWVLLFAVYQFAFIRPNDLIVPATPDPSATVQTAVRALPGTDAAAGATPLNLLHAEFRGVGEVMFQDSLLTGAVFLVAILVNSRVSAGFAVLGSAVGALTALALGGDGFWVYHGLYGFNAVLCAIAIGGLFYALTWRSALYAVLAAAMSTAAMAGIAALLSPLGMPALTAPFVLVTWLFLLPGTGFSALHPVPLAALDTPERTRRALLAGRLPRRGGD